MHDVISLLEQFLPIKIVVKGIPRHSESNGGIERLNREVEKKIRSWMQENKNTK